MGHSLAKLESQLPSLLAHGRYSALDRTRVLCCLCLNEWKASEAATLYIYAWVPSSAKEKMRDLDGIYTLSKILFCHLKKWLVSSRTERLEVDMVPSKISACLKSSSELESETPGSISGASCTRVPLLPCPPHDMKSNTSWTEKTTEWFYSCRL